MSTKKISNPAPGTEAVEAKALNQVGTAADNDAPIKVKGDNVADTMDTPVEDKAPTPVETQAPVEDKTDDIQVTIQSLKASVESLTSQLQETRERLEAKERAEQRAIRLEKAGIPKALGSFIRDDADLEALNETLAGLSRTTPAGVGAVSTPTLPTVGSKNPGGEILSIDEMIARAEANNDRAALSSLKLAKLSAASNLF